MSLCTPSPCLDKPVAWIYTSPCGPPSCWGRRARCSPCWGRARPSCSSTGPRQRWAHPPLSVSVDVRPKYFSWVFTCLQRGHVLRLADQHSLIEFWPRLTDAKKMNVTEKSPTCRKCGLFCTGQPGAGRGCRRSRWSEPARPLYSEMTLKMIKETPNTCSPIPPYLFPPWWSSPPTPLPPLSYCSFSTLWTPPSKTLRTLSRCWSDHFPHSLKVFFLRWPAAWGPSQP